MNNPSEGLSLYSATPRKLRPLCAFTPTRPAAGAYKDLVTCKEQGLAIDDYYIMRAVVGPPGLSAGQQKFWVDLFKQVFEHADWKDFMTKNALDAQFLAGDDFKKFIESYEKLHRDIATKNGWI